MLFILSTKCQLPVTWLLGISSDSLKPTAVAKCFALNVAGYSVPLRPVLSQVKGQKPEVITLYYEGVWAVSSGTASAAVSLAAVLLVLDTNSESQKGQITLVGCFSKD